MTMMMMMTMSPASVVGDVAGGGGHRRRYATAYIATSLVSLSVLLATLLLSSFPAAANAFSVSNPAAADAASATFQHPNTIITATRQFLPEQYTGRRAASASRLVVCSTRDDEDDAAQDCTRRRRTPSSLRDSNSSMTSAAFLATAIASTQLLFSPLVSSSSTTAFAYNYDESDKYASETVTNVVTKLQSSAGDVDATFNTLEEVAKIITEGKGVGGTLTYGKRVVIILIFDMCVPVGSDCVRVHLPPLSHPIDACCIIICVHFL